MARPLRIQYPGAVYHITCRGNERREIFRDDFDRKKFLELLKESASIYNIKLYGYVIMPNHFHLLLETPLGNLGEFMRQFNIAYTGYYNRRHERVGHLYQGRYKSILVEKESYLSKLSRYIHLNPIRTKEMEERPIKEKMEYLNRYRWSSLPGYIDIKKREGLTDYGIVLSAYGGDNEKGRLAYSKEIYNDINCDLAIKEQIVGQSVLGEEKFIEQIKDKYVKQLYDRECPSLKALVTYKTAPEVISAIEEETGNKIEEIRLDKGNIRQIVMDLLYRFGGLTGREIGDLLGIDYSTVSVGRKRLREKILKDESLRKLFERIEKRLSRIKN